MNLTPRAVAYIAHEEGLVPEAYRDSQGIWTWALGVTDASGHGVYRYRDNPQPLEKCLEISVWLLRNRYLPAVAGAFGGHELAEHQLAAALSFQWNTGAIRRASWVKSFLAGQILPAEMEIMQWRNPAEVVARRRRERDLFFRGEWPKDMSCPVWDVAKPSYRPKGAKPVDILPMLEAAMAA